MKYFVIKNANEPDITGNVFSQISEHKSWVWDNHNFLRGLNPNELPEKEFELNYLILHRWSKLTDFLSDSLIFMGFIFNTKVKNIFENHRLPSHKFYRTFIEAKGVTLKNYYWFFPINQLSKDIDFDNSLFLISNRFVEAEIFDDEIKFTSISEIIKFEKYNPNKRVRPKRIKMLSKISLDIFQFGIFSFDWIISETLKNAIERNEITGYDLKQIKWLEDIN